MDEEVLPSLRLSSHVVEFKLNEESLEELQEECVELLRTQLNQVLLPPIEIKLLGTHHDWKHETNGFLNEKYQVELTSMRNFIGLKLDWKRLTESYKKELSDFFDQQLQKFTKKAKPCPLCGRPSDRFDSGVVNLYI
ncbi:hypothetical protein [Hazenella coriacea]|uniref:Uncharacterized protein n=1 Tax=Hazenella coriacea TaxID=1179467 RepID=A0A4R3L7M7_9BACL|nr:hypothetical protein [Hazenella coriacea]TCS94970.1 hypothetical protein EDD58_103395 [Hazenella coriacea]